MAAKRLSTLKKVGKALLLLMTVLAAGALVLAFLAKFIRPSFSHLIAYCGLFFFYILILNVVLTVVWLVIDYPYALLTVIPILLNVNNIDKHFQLRAQNRPETCANCIKVMSYNARVFGVYQANDDVKLRMSNKRTLVNFFRNECPDILCVQEYFYDKSGKLDFNTTEEILHALNLPDNERNYRLYLNNNSGPHQSGLAVFSRYRIVNSGWVELSDSSANKAMFVDIRYNGDTLRVYNVHLRSLRLGSGDYETGKALLHSDMSDPNIEQKALRLFDKISYAFDQRQYQAQDVRAHIDSCKHPIIICGDFNDSPASYSVHKIGHGFKDSFRSSGQGLGATYFDDAFPSYRIDYIFHSKQYNDFGHTICEDIKISDHRPIYTYISILDKK